MEAGFLLFDPASEYEIIETFDYEEEIQRPESLRFFTLDEQLLDYFDKVLPKKGKVTKHEYNRISTQVDRLREIYNTTITVTDTDYAVDLSRKDLKVSWVKPIYSDYELTSYSYAESFLPLYGPTLRSTPNYYPRLLSALPKPYRPTGSQGVPYVGNATMVDDEGKHPINTLGVYHRTKGVIHEDGSFSVLKLPVPNTADEMKVKGFYIEKRPVDIPNPLSEHPFFASEEPHRYLTTEPLERIFPTIETILTHGVPTTFDPYNEGKKYLKVYDVKLTQIPWSLWKQRFPPVGTITATPTILSITFPKSQESIAPSKSLQDIYKLSWLPGLEPREWLCRQEDSGALVSKMLLTQVSKSGLVPPAVLGERPESQAVKSTPEECFTFDTFDSFVNAGLYRKGQCIPMPQIMQEKLDILSSGKVAWNDTTSTDILKDHQELLKFFQFIETPVKQKLYETYASQPESDGRRMIKALLRDPERDPVDKASAIELLLRGASEKDEQWFGDEGGFLICGHTLAVLRGDLEEDPKTFYNKWTAIDGGFRACTFCGEQVSADVFIAQDDFDESGNAIVNYDVLDTPSAFHGHTQIESFSNSLGKLRPSFTLENPGEAILYLLLSLLQVLPSESQLIPIVQFVRDLTAVLRSNKKIDKATKERIEGVLGIVGMVTLLLTHNPFLIPRRSFGSKVLKLSGFPRDTEDSNDAPALDIVISVLKTTFESSPSTFKGPIATLMRQLISKPKDIRKEAIGFLKQIAKKFEAQYISGRERYAIPILSEVTQTISLPVVRRESNVFRPSDKGEDEKMAECSLNVPRSYLTGRLPPSVRQEEMVFYPAKPSHLAQAVHPAYTPPVRITFTDAEIRRRAGLGFPKGLKLEKLDSFIRSDTDGVALLSLLQRVLDILVAEGFSLTKASEYRSASVYIKSHLLRDSARGLLYELLQDVISQKNKAGLVNALAYAVQRDLSLKMLLLTKEEATRQDSDLRTREREVFKMRMRNMNDTEREITKMLLDIGIAPYVITNEDREIFSREYNLPDPEELYAAEITEQDIDRPEEGYNATRDVDEDGAQAVVNGHELEVDYGDYGDRRNEPTDRDYERQYWTNLGEDFGI